MHIAKNRLGYPICARCGKKCEALTKDHFVPLACKMNVNEEGNLVGVCKQCNQEKGCRVVSPEWYLFLQEEQQKKLWRYLRYARHMITDLCDDPELLEKIKNL